MGLEDQLKRVLDAALAELTSAAAAERDAARKEGFDRGRTLGWEDGLEQGRFDGRHAAEEESRAAVDAAVAATRAEAGSAQAATARLIDAVRALDRARTLAETLETLAGCAGREAARVGVLLVRGNRLEAFRLIGFEITEREFPLEDASVIAQAIRSRAAATTEAGGASAPPGFASLDSTHACFAVPVVLASQVVAVLYADQQGSSQATSTRSWPEALELLTRHAARCIEALTAMKAARTYTGMTTAEDHVQLT